MDADDIMRSDRIKKQAVKMESDSELGVLSSLVNHFPTDMSNSNGYQKYINWMNQVCSSKEIANSRFIESPFAHPSIMYRKELFLKYGYYSQGDFPEDYELWLRLIDKGVKMEKLNECLLDWRDSDSRLSRISPKYSLKSFQKLKAIYLNKWLRDNILGKMPIHVWGAGKIAKQQIKHLEELGILIDCSYDVDPKKIKRYNNKRSVLPIDEIPNSGKYFIIVLVAKNDARNKIVKFLSDRNYLPCKDYILAA